jgi:ADP-ribosylglycohydrolase
MQLRSKFRGALLGVAVGDALGAPFEGVPAVDPAALHAFLRNRDRSFASE